VEKLASEVVDSLLTGFGGEVKITEETICIIARISSVEEGIDI
jgi:hypothetical protein